MDTEQIQTWVHLNLFICDFNINTPCPISRLWHWLKNFLRSWSHHWSGLRGWSQDCHCSLSGLENYIFLWSRLWNNFLCSGLLYAKMAARIDTAASMAPVNGATFCVNACCSNCNRGFSSVSLSHCYNRGTTYGSGLKEQRWITRINKRITTWPSITKWTKAHHGVARSIYPGTEALQAVWEKLEVRQTSRCPPEA